jgi:3-methyl-2-oxobutanoate hydroxymethyltransferase
MSSRPPGGGKISLTELGEMKRRRDPIVMVTVYDYPSGRLADSAGVDLVLVGDSAAMVVMGYEATVPATMEEMVLLTRWVARGAERPLVVGDMPFGSYQVSDEAAVENAIRLVKEAGADLVKLEGAGSILSRVRAISEAGIPVMGHVGLTPQSATKLGGFRAQGRSAEKARRVYDDALALEEAGACALVLEAIPAAIATAVTRALPVPTIGIGAGAGTDGQVLVWHDLLGLYEGRSPRFVKRYGEVGRHIREALEHYVADVRSGAFPEDRHSYAIPEDELARFEDTVRAG